ncbi:hypothetical protein E2C01_101968 [Portunus trituberculatus]|uniref:Uncharacterized protein n=1 Tax=Portunus trituberculatus TaxID=210409 RepID=A0A5B7KN50_PORTR|nr:hypothetical protein [Portunus trituberculatus]
MPESESQLSKKTTVVIREPDVLLVSVLGKYHQTNTNDVMRMYMTQTINISPETNCGETGDKVCFVRSTRTLKRHHRNYRAAGQLL